MKKSKRILLTCVAIILVIALSVGATLAYLTFTTQTEKNVFTFGNVKIALYESRFDRENGYDPDPNDKTYYTWLVQEDAEPEGFDGYESGLDYSIGGTAFSDDQIIEDSKTYQEYITDEDGNPAELLPGADRYNKFAYVKNTGKSDAYIRIHMQVPVTMFAMFTAEQIGQILGSINFSGPARDSYLAFRMEALFPVDSDYSVEDYLAGKCGNEFISNDLLGIAAILNAQSSEDPTETAENYIGLLRDTGYLIQDEETGEYYFDIISYRYEPLAADEMTYWGRGYNIGVPKDFDWDEDTFTTLEALGFDTETMTTNIKVYAEAVQAKGFEEGTTVTVGGEEVELTPMQAAWYAVDESSLNLWNVYRDLSN